MSFVDAPIVIGHRGAAGLIPENTLPSFRRAYACAVAAVELDVHWHDNALIVLHDDTLDRTTNGTGPFKQLDLRALRQLDAGGGWPIPLLPEVLAELPAGVGINIELKGADTAAPVAALLQSAGPFAPGDASNRPDVLVSSFDHDELRRFHALAPDIRVAPLLHEWRDDAWALATALDAFAINLNHRIATPARLAEASRRGLRTILYTVNDLDRARALIAAGATGVFTDHPDRITRAALLAP
ncbi:MAG: glycerophosphodiester phosphodiesterase [Gammaproteobacteria bacterium]